MTQCVQDPGHFSLSTACSLQSVMEMVRRHTLEDRK